MIVDRPLSHLHAITTSLIHQPYPTAYLLLLLVLHSSSDGPTSILPIHRKGRVQARKVSCPLPSTCRLRACPIGQRAANFSTVTDGRHSLRAKRSRKDRPCDHCRISKRSCHIAVRGQACEHCARAGRECSFRAPPLNRHRKTSTTPTSTATPNGYPTSTEAGTSSLASRFGSTGGLANGPSQSPASWMGERSTLALARPLPASGVRAFLDSLDERVAQQEDEDTLGYSSLDADVTEEEESHYLGESCSRGSH